MRRIKDHIKFILEKEWEQGRVFNFKTGQFEEFKPEEKAIPNENKS
jgi:hypothetical protein